MCCFTFVLLMKGLLVDQFWEERIEMMEKSFQGWKGSPWVCFHITYITPLLNYDMVEESFQDWQHLTLAIFERQAEMSYYSCKKIVKNAHSFGNCTIW